MLYWDWELTPYVRLFVNMADKCVKHKDRDRQDKKRLKHITSHKKETRYSYSFCHCCCWGNPLQESRTLRLFKTDRDTILQHFSSIKC